MSFLFSYLLPPFHTGQKMTHFSQQIDSNENPIIQSLEALLNTEEPSVKIPLDCFEAMSLRSRFREGYSLDQTKDSGFAYHPSNSFASSWQHSGNTSIQNVSYSKLCSC